MGKRFLYVFLLLVALVSCGTGARLSRLKKNGSVPDIQLPPQPTGIVVGDDTVRPDSVVITDDSGNQMYLLKAVKDSASGEMVASDVINAAVVVARFRNVAERSGKVFVEFDLKVPSDICDSRWQLSLSPLLRVGKDSALMDRILVTGKEYRKAQLRGYQQYERFVSRIIGDSTSFIDYRNLEIFLRRTLPAIFAYKTDSSYVSDEQFEGIYGVTEMEALRHYTDDLALRRNESRIARKGKMYEKYVKAPIIRTGVRLDTVLVDVNGDFIYRYVQEVPARRDMKKIEVVLSGEILEQGKRIFEIPSSEPLSFYVSSLAAFADKTPRYKLKIVERRAFLNADCLLAFKVGKSDIDLTLGDNEAQSRRMKSNILRVLEDDDYELDSITIASFASPEGSRRANEQLCAGRAKSASTFFSQYVHFAQDSLQLPYSAIPVLARSGGENWSALAACIASDDRVGNDFMECFNESMKIRDLDERERRLRASANYSYVLKEIYPKLRTVDFNFFLHRKGMVKDTIHTTELDSTYMRGIELLEDRDFAGALEILAPYADFNTAVAYVCLDRNASALAVLKDCARTPEKDYLSAVLFSRSGDDQKAVKYFLAACAANPSFIFRGNLDPEISLLIKKYGLSNLLNNN